MTASTEEPGTNPRHAGAPDLVEIDPAPPYLWWLTLISGIIGVLFGLFMLSLRPTTVLAAQHHATFGQRFAAFPLEVRLLSRFVSPKEQAATHSPQP